jgi:hypothetical protein
MTAKSPLPVARPVASVIKHEDKTEKLKGFIGAALDRLPPAAAGHTITLVARSANSPVARALAGLSERLVAARCTVNVILASLDAEAPVAGSPAADWRIVSEAPAFLGQIRFARNPRLADAHEQLVLGATTCWVGDCMRRDPSKRDAFELYATASAETASTAAQSFARLWGVSEPVALRSTRPPARTTTVTALDPADAAVALAAAMAGEAPHVVVSTLH